MNGSDAALGELVLRGIDDELFRGAVLRVERGGRLLHEEAWGHSIRTDTRQAALDTGTLFDIASLTKLFTTTAILRLVSTGRIALNDSVGGLYRRLFAPGGAVGGSAGTAGAGTGSAKGPGTAGSAVARGLDEALLSRVAASLADRDVASLLSHASGIRAWYPFYTGPRELFEAKLADLLEREPRHAGTLYSDLNFMILGRIIEGATGTPLARAMRDLVLSPIGLDRTSYGRPVGPAAASEFGNRIERGMVADLGLSFDGWRDDSRPILGEPDDGNCHYFFGGVAGHAGIFSDARDLCRLGTLYLRDGLVGSGRYLSPGLSGEALRDRGSGRGLGFQLGENYPGGGAGHTGFTGTYLVVNAKSDLVIAILTNRLHVPEPRDITQFRRELAAAALAAYGS